MTTDPTTISGRVNRADGPESLRDVTSAAWPDDGQRAANLFAWIPRDAHSTDRTAATRAGQTAHTIASFLADHSDEPANTSANPALWQAFARSLAPYVGAMVGDGTGVEGFEPLDGPGSQMRRRAPLFAAMSKDNDANQSLDQCRLGASAYLRDGIRESRSGRTNTGRQRGTTG